MQPIKVLELRSTYKGGGGPDKTILNSLKYHDHNVVDIRAIYIRGSNDHEFMIDKMAKEMGLQNYHDIKEKGKFEFKILNFLKKYAIENNIDIIHSHEFKTNIYNFFLKKSLAGTNKKFIMTAHNWAGQGFKSKLYQKVDIEVIRHLDHIIAVSESVKNILCSSNINSSKISVIHNGIDINYWTKKENLNDLKSQLNIKKAYPILGAVGRLMPEKDIPTMLKAFSLVLNEFPHAKLILVGEAKELVRQSEYLKIVKKLGITDHVIFHGFTRQLLEIYNTFDIYLMTSITEGLPNVILEAMAMNLPIISSNVGGISELVVNNENGFLLEAGDYYGFAEKIIQLATDREKLKKFGLRSRKIIEDNFNFEQRLRLVENLYHKLHYEKKYD